MKIGNGNKAEAGSVPLPPPPVSSTNDITHATAIVSTPSSVQAGPNGLGTLVILPIEVRNLTYRFWANNLLDECVEPPLEACLALQTLRQLNDPSIRMISKQFSAEFRSIFVEEIRGRAFVEISHNSTYLEDLLRLVKTHSSVPQPGSIFRVKGIGLIVDASSFCNISIAPPAVMPILSRLIEGIHTLWYLRMYHDIEPSKLFVVIQYGNLRDFIIGCITPVRQISHLPDYIAFETLAIRIPIMDQDATRRLMLNAVMKAEYQIEGCVQSLLEHYPTSSRSAPEFLAVFSALAVIRLLVPRSLENFHRCLGETTSKFWGDLEDPWDIADFFRLVEL